ncbi:hypothetical protein [Desulfovibrio gilichinskyi]|uniref:Lipoprotein n=1 Tax=Desulfovibrio gilichinskyi TaxID=1519643 RepID=A0A1X7DSN3_9BACT|nr:hypothetical protein [Desulfovibrio gilichinskyi]SMF21033.1 hypothetical protein SAMN06295933_2313 [Desulfovibrio gilichinskyi]
MKPFRITLLITIICAIAFLSGCRTATIQNIEMAPILTDSSNTKTLDQVKNSIIRAGYSLNWKMSDIAPGHLVGTLNLRSHQAVVDITYTTKDYSINYKSSTNLKHKGDKIHSNYNAWVNNLSNAINRELEPTIQSTGK